GEQRGLRRRREVEAPHVAEHVAAVDTQRRVVDGDVVDVVVDLRHAAWRRPAARDGRDLGNDPARQRVQHVEEAAAVHAVRRAVHVVVARGDHHHPGTGELGNYRLTQGGPEVGVARGGGRPG